MRPRTFAPQREGRVEGRKGKEEKGKEKKNSTALASSSLPFRWYEHRSKARWRRDRGREKKGRLIFKGAAQASY